MNKSQLKDFAIYSRNKLRQDVISQLHLMDITEEGIHKPNKVLSDLIEFNTQEFTLNDDDVKKYHRLVNKLEKESETKDFSLAFDDFVEEVAYTWFNRIIAIRFMEINSYIPHGFRVLSSSQEGIIEPEVLKNYDLLDIGFSKEEISTLDCLSLKGDVFSQNKMFQMIFMKQCHALNENLPELFESTDDFKDFLLTLSFTDEQSVIYKLVNEVSEASFDINSVDGSGQIEVIGWLYQYYNTKKKNEVFKRPASRKIRKEEVPAATQLFTPKWIVKYMVQNSLGRLWIERLLATGDKRTEKEIADFFGWDHYLQEAKQESEVLRKLVNLRQNRRKINLEDIQFMDPAMGSGHILVYAFDVFMKIYLSEGYQPQAASISILKHNLYGLDIDDRAHQLSYFSLMMKGREHNRNFLNSNIKLKLYAIEESNNILKDHVELISNERMILNQLNEIIDFFVDAKEYGSILKPTKAINFKKIRSVLKKYKQSGQVTLESLDVEKSIDKLNYLTETYELLYKKYDLVVLNPPYLSNRGMNKKMTKYLKEHYNNSKADYFSVFMDVASQMLKKDGFYGMINQHSWMFTSNFQNFRNSHLESQQIMNMIHLGTGAFQEISGEVVQSTVFVMRKHIHEHYISMFSDMRRLDKELLINQKNVRNRYLNDVYNVKVKELRNIPNFPVAYWISESALNNFISGESIDNLSEFTGSQNITGNNKKYLRYFWEVSSQDIGKFKQWSLYSKGGEFKKYYGNLIHIIDWSKNGRKFYKENRTSNLLNEKYWYKEGITYTAVTTRGTNFRYLPPKAIFDKGGPTIIEPEHLKYLLGLLNSKVAKYYADILNPTINLQIKDVKSIPILMPNKAVLETVKKITEENIRIAKQDWDSNETSLDYEVDPLFRCGKNNKNSKISDSYNKYKNESNNLFSKFKENEEKLNGLFIDIYSLENDLKSQVSDKNVTVLKVIDVEDDIYDDIKGNRFVLTRKEIIKNYISYSVGCMMGRYSIDYEGLIYAGGNWDYSRYERFEPIEDNILIISEDGSYPGDIVERFVELVEIMFGAKHLEKNLEFIADSLRKTSVSSRERIRNYFVKYFYRDHVQKYKKTPIYWMYDASSGKTMRQSEYSFKALVYMHRYDKDTSGKVRIDYLHSVQKSYESELSHLENELVHTDSAKEEKRMRERMTELQKKLKEIQDYDEALGHIALDRIDIDLDDGVKANHKKVQTDSKGKTHKILTEIK